VQPPLTSGLCRVTLPDQSSTVLHVTPDMTVQVLIQRLFDKRGYPYKHFKVKIQSNNEQVWIYFLKICLPAKINNFNVLQKQFFNVFGFLKILI